MFLYESKLGKKKYLKNRLMTFILENLFPRIANSEIFREYLFSQKRAKFRKTREN